MMRFKKISDQTTVGNFQAPTPPFPDERKGILSSLTFSLKGNSRRCFVKLAALLLCGVLGSILASGKDCKKQPSEVDQEIKERLGTLAQIEPSTTIRKAIKTISAEMRGCASQEFISDLEYYSRTVPDNDVGQLADALGIATAKERGNRPKEVKVAFRSSSTSPFAIALLREICPGCSIDEVAKCVNEASLDDTVCNKGKTGLGSALVVLRCRYKAISIEGALSAVDTVCRKLQDSSQGNPGSTSVASQGGNQSQTGQKQSPGVGAGSGQSGNPSEGSSGGVVPIALHASPESGGPSDPNPAAPAAGQQTNLTNSGGKQTDNNKSVPENSTLQFFRGLLGGSSNYSMVGYEQSSASSSKFNQNFFADFFMADVLQRGRLRGADDRIASQYLNPTDRVRWVLGPPHRIFADLRITSIPQQDSTGAENFGKLVAPAGFAGALANVKVSDLARAFEFTTGFENRILPRMSFYSLANESGDARTRLTVSMFTSFGIVTPLDTPTSTEVPILARIDNSPLFQQLNVPSDKKYLAFVPPDRDRFYRQAFAGFRIRRHYYDQNDQPMGRPSAFGDIAYGVNEAATGGRIHGGVFKLEGFMPVPFSMGNFFYLYGTMFLKPSRGKVNDGHILVPTTDQIGVNDPSVFQVRANPLDRDYYRFGIGMDMAKVLSDIGKLMMKGSSPPNNNTPQAQ